MEADLQVQSADSIGIRSAAVSSRLLQEITAAVAAAIAETEASAQQAMNEERQQFEAVERELHRQLAAALDDLEKQRDDARAVKNQYTIERAARARAEEWLAAAQSTQNQIAAGYTERLSAAEAEIEASRREVRRLAESLEAESAERARLTVVLESIRSAMGGVIPVTPVPGPGTSASIQAEAASVPLSAGDTPPAQESTENRGKKEESPSGSERNLTFIGRAAAEPEPRRRPAPDPALSDALTQMLGQVEESYQNDVASLQSPFDVVDHLVAQLRTSRELFLMRCNNDKTVANEEFDRQISELLDTKGATAFGRHLGIAWHEMSQPAERATPSAVA